MTEVEVDLLSGSTLVRRVDISPDQNLLEVMTVWIAVCGAGCSLEEIG
jgi:hypothetical protein